MPSFLEQLFPATRQQTSEPSQVQTQLTPEQLNALSESEKQRISQEQLKLLEAKQNKAMAKKEAYAKKSQQAWGTQAEEYDKMAFEQEQLADYYSQAGRFATGEYTTQSIIEWAEAGASGYVAQHPTQRLPMTTSVTDIPAQEVAMQSRGDIIGTSPKLPQKSYESQVLTGINIDPSLLASISTPSNISTGTSTIQGYGIGTSEWEKGRNQIPLVHAEDIGKYTGTNTPYWLVTNVQGDPDAILRQMELAGQVQYNPNTESVFGFKGMGKTETAWTQIEEYQNLFQKETAFKQEMARINTEFQLNPESFAGATGYKADVTSAGTTYSLSPEYFQGLSSYKEYTGLFTPEGQFKLDVYQWAVGKAKTRFESLPYTEQAKLSLGEMGISVEKSAIGFGEFGASLGSTIISSFGVKTGGSYSLFGGWKSIDFNAPISKSAGVPSRYGRTEWESLMNAPNIYAYPFEVLTQRPSVSVPVVLTASFLGAGITSGYNIYSTERSLGATRLGAVSTTIGETMTSLSPLQPQGRIWTAVDIGKTEQLGSSKFTNIDIGTTDAGKVFSTQGFIQYEKPISLDYISYKPSLLGGEVKGVPAIFGKSTLQTLDLTAYNTIQLTYGSNVFATNKLESGQIQTRGYGFRDVITEGKQVVQLSRYQLGTAPYTEQVTQLFRSSDIGSMVKLGSVTETYPYTVFGGPSVDAIVTTTTPKSTGEVYRSVTGVEITPYGRAEYTNAFLSPSGKVAKSFGQTEFIDKTKVFTGEGGTIRTDYTFDTAGYSLGQGKSISIENFRKLGDEFMTSKGITKGVIGYGGESVSVNIGYKTISPTTFEGAGTGAGVGGRTYNTYAFTGTQQISSQGGLFSQRESASVIPVTKTSDVFLTSALQPTAINTNLASIQSASSLSSILGISSIGALSSLTRTNAMTTIKPMSISSITSKITPITTVRPTTMNITSLLTTLTTITPTTPPTTIIPKVPPIITGPTIFVPPVWLGGDFTLEGGTRRFKGKQQKKYTPSFEALVFNIKGKMPKGIETGARLRPIPKGFTFAFSKPKFKYKWF